MASLRVFPARFLIHLKDFAGVDAETAHKMSSYLNQSEYAPMEKPPKPATMLLQIDYGDKDRVKPGMKIRISDYSITGDEGGTYTTFGKLEILRGPKTKHR